MERGGERASLSRDASVDASIRRFDYR